MSTRSQPRSGARPRLGAALALLAAMALGFGAAAPASGAAAPASGAAAPASGAAAPASGAPRPSPTSTTIEPLKPLPGPAIPAEQTVGGPELAGSSLVVGAFALRAPPVTGDVSFVIADLDTGAVLAAKAPHARMRPASTIKALLAVALIPRLDATSTVKGTADQARADGTRVGIMPGTTYTVSQLFQGLIMASGNDAAFALADAAGGRAQTLDLVNSEAGRLGAWDTRVLDPSGLDADGQATSAYDLALIGQAAMALPDYRRYATTRTATFPGGRNFEGKVIKPFQIGNHNRLLWNFAGTIGVKNGYTGLARQTFIGAAARGGHTLLITRMGAPTSNWRESAAMLDWGFANVDRVTPVGHLVEPGTAPRPAALGPIAPSASTAPPASTTPAPAPTTTQTSTARAAAPKPNSAALATGPDADTSPTGALGRPVVRYGAATGSALILLLAWGQARKRRSARVRARARYLR